jgi:response regulator of citrate/malate metabolism
MDEHRACSGPIRTYVEDRQLRQLRHIREGRTIDQIIKEECGKQGVAKVEIQGGSKRWTVSAVRARIALRGREDLGLSAAEIARHLGVNTSSITRAVEGAESRDHGKKHN